MRDDIQDLLDGFKKKLEEADRAPDDEHTRELHANKDKASYELDILNGLIKYVEALDSDRVDPAIKAVISGSGTKSSNVGD